MALDSYTALQASVADWLKGSDLGMHVPDMIALCEAEMNAQLAQGIANGANIRPMVNRTTITIASEYLDSPAANYSMISPITLEVTGLNTPWAVDYVSEENLLGLKYSQDVARSEIYAQAQAYPPQYYTLTGGSLRFFPVPEASFTADFAWFTKLSALSEATASNWVLAYHPNAYLYGTIAQAEFYGWNDSRVATCAQLFANAMEGIVASYPRIADRRPLRADYPLDRSCGLPC